MENDIVKVLRDLCDNNYNDNFEKVLNDLLDYYDHDNTGVVKALDSINESISLEGLDAMEVAIEEIKKLRAENKRMKVALERLRDCNWVITPLDRMDAVREIARNALKEETT